MSKALILSGGAPNATLMAGALYAFEEEGVKFDIISAAGAGSVVGLIYIAPKGGKSSKESLRNMVDCFSVHDAIYNYFPINYKVFKKPGMLAKSYDKLLRNFFWKNAFEKESANSLQRFFRDWMLLFYNLFLPTDLNPMSRGLCANDSFINSVVDFNKLKHIESEFYINAYNITDRRMENFSKKDISDNEEYFHAAMAFPFLYAPYHMNGKWYIEGATVDCLNYEFLVGGYFQITQESLKELESLTFPEDGLKKLRSLKNIEFSNKVSFLKTLKKIIGKDLAQKFESILLFFIKEDGNIKISEHFLRKLKSFVFPHDAIEKLQLMKKLKPCDEESFLTSLVEMMGEEQKRKFESIVLHCAQVEKDKIGKHREVDTIVIFDVLGNDKLIQTPRNLYDAWIHSIIDPMVAITKDDTTIFEWKHNKRWEYNPVTKQVEAKEKRKLLKVKLYEHLPEDQLPYVFDWSYSNLKILFDVGLEAGHRFLGKEKNREELDLPMKSVNDNTAGQNVPNSFIK